MTDKKVYLIDIRQSQNYAQYLKLEGWVVERINNTNYFIKKIPLLGSILKVQRPEKTDFKTIEKLERKYSVFQTIIEPTLPTIINTFADTHNQLYAHGFKLSKSPFLPAKTLQIDLTQPLSRITANFKKNTRSAIKRGETVTIKEYSTPTDLKIFYDAWKNSVSFRRFVPSLTSLLNLRQSHPNNYSIFLSSHNNYNKIIGGAVFTRSYTDFSYYWYGFTNHEGRTSLSQYSLLFNGILWAKKMNCRLFDFEGIYDERFPLKSWLGFSHFKKSFGGVEVLYPGCYIKYCLPFKN